MDLLIERPGVMQSLVTNIRRKYLWIRKKWICPH